METFLQDVRYALRTLARSPGFTLVAVSCLAIGIGVNTTIFSIVDTIFVKALPFVQPDRLVDIREVQQRHANDRAGPSYRNFLDWRDESRAFSAMAAYDDRSLTLSGTGEPERVIGGVISANLFDLIGVRPALGRGFRADEDQVGAERVLILSDELWHRRYGGEPSIVGTVVTANGLPHTVIGVMPPRFEFPENDLAWVTAQPVLHDARRGSRGVNVVARLAPGASISQAQRELAGVAKRLEARYPVENRGWGVLVRPLRSAFMPEDVRLIVMTMMGAVSFVLLIACANVANLLLARATGRQREMALRSALGAGRLRILRQLLTEAVVIALAAAALGVLIAEWGVRLVDAAIPAENPLPYYITWAVDARALTYTFLLAIGTGVLFGLAPALQASKSDLVEALKDGTRGSGTGGRRSRLRSSLVVVEVALSLVLLVGASLFVQSFINLQKASGGFDPAQLMSMRFYMPGDPYSSRAAISRRVDDVVRRVEALPGVVSATASNLIPFGGGGGGGSVVIEGHPVPRGEEPSIWYGGVTAHFFRTIGVRVLAGRDLTDAEGSDSIGVAVVNQTMARKFWPRTSAVGERFRLADDTSGKWITIVGVVPDIRNNGLDPSSRPQAAAYLPYPWLATRNTGITIRTTMIPTQITAAVRTSLRAADPGMPIFEVRTIDQVRRLSFWQFGLFGWMFGVFGAIALLLAAVGVYGVIAYGVSQRTQEIGVRLALGALRGDVLRLVVGQGARLAGFGVAVGLVGAFAVTRVIATQLYGVSPTDPVSFGGIAIFLTAIALLASYIPAQRAARVDPMTSLRND
ncbi:MAG: ABC transporter permease [Gemmatimonadaceae bacterium]